MINYLPARISRPLMPKDDDMDFNPEQEQRDEDRLFETAFENDIYKKEEGIYE